MKSHNKLTHTMVGLHWLVALMMIGSIAFGIYIEELPRSDIKFEYIQLHKSIGILVLIFAIIRIVNTSKNGLPSQLGTPKKRQDQIAKIAHIVLLAGTILMPVSGVMMSIGGGHSVALFGLNLIPSGEKIEWLGSMGYALHGIGGKLMIAAILLHIAGALKHSLINKDGTMRRMMGKAV
ncbi:cytochrome b [Neptuniibacter caesariensis]|uniref:Cytochrome b561, putative n=1 Tax=Neptuniibacter caesariensis TaxID=207954 RepID=A0A7U8GT61_NEPCE|nr:cytochrome b [Neptuniibacter caesariensis]EAR62096.1 cytochrome b561, putative [Oceanospirillum sp. MED92] [Neptuniibacter caesariensis]